VKGLHLDAESFQVNRDTEPVIEKRVELPENWHLALENIQKYAYPDEAEKKLEKPLAFVQTTPYGPFVKKFAKVDLGWQSTNQWKFAQIGLRNDIGFVIVGATSEISNRLDGRKNPLYDVIRNTRMLRQVKSYLLEAKPITDQKWEVTGSGNTHYVTKKKGRRARCDCKDFQYRHTVCKHIQAVEKPRLEIVPLYESEWKVNAIQEDGRGSDSHEVSYNGKHYSCSCHSYATTQICRHVVAILRHQNDFQFTEFMQDFAAPKPKQASSSIKHS